MRVRADVYLDCSDVARQRGGRDNGWGGGKRKSGGGGKSAEAPQSSYTTLADGGFCEGVITCDVTCFGNYHVKLGRKTALKFVKSRVLRVAKTIHPRLVLFRRMW